jgi:uncharacterized protein YigE (DUF2233 family)
MQRVRILKAQEMLMASFVAAGSLFFGLNTLLVQAVVLRPSPMHLQHVHLSERYSGKPVVCGSLPHRHAYASRYTTAHHRKLSAKQLRMAKAEAAKRAAQKRLAARPIPPQQFADDLVDSTIAPGVVHRYCRSPLNIHVIDIDMAKAPVKVQPYLAGEQFDRLADVAVHARESKAIAAINANYFKKNGTPLGTLIIDGEWIAGPIYDRVSMGITRTGEVKIDRVSLNGVLVSDNPNLNKIWVNNINQPRRNGSRLVAYTGRWGKNVRMDYAGCLVAVDSQGQVLNKSTTFMSIPAGGYVLSDSKNSPIDSLSAGDKVQLTWQTQPGDWQDVVEAVSGGPMLIKDGKLFLDLQDEKFRRGWTGAQIRARTIAGVTRNNHLLLATVEGPHTLWDCAKFLYKLGAVDAMNLDGGGSTTMIVNGQRVTGLSHQRRVATSIVVLDTRKAAVSQAVYKRSGVFESSFQLPALRDAGAATVSERESAIKSDVTAALPALAPAEGICEASDKVDNGSNQSKADAGNAVNNDYNNLHVNLRSPESDVAAPSMVP